MKRTDEITLAAVKKEEKYDDSVKEILKIPRILAPILKATVEEYADMDIEDIIPCITEVDDMVPVDSISAKAATKLDTEDSSLSDKLVRYDLHLKLPGNSEKNREIRLFLFVDLEIQNEAREKELGYPIEKRAMYYVARELSSQLGVLTEETDYNVLQKCYSIWICNENLVSDRDTITRYTVSKLCEYGSIDVPKENFDLMEVVIVRRGKVSNTDGIFDYLNGLFTSDIDRMDKHSGIKRDEDAKEGTKMISGLGHSIAVKHEEIGESRLAKLIKILLDADRVEDAKKATENEEARKEFYREFNIID